VAQNLDISPAELFQMIETRWKENSHAKR
jgi:hypothetical protein